MNTEIAPLLKSIGIHVFAGSHNLAEAQHFTELLAEGITAVRPQAYSHFAYVDSKGKASSSRVLKDIRLLELDWRAKENRMTGLLTQHGRMLVDPDEPYAEFAFSRSLAAAETHAHHFLDQLSLGFTDFFTPSSEASFISRLSSLFERCVGRYGIVHSASCDLLLRSEVGLVRGNPAGYLPEEYIFDRSERLSFHRARFGEIIAGANWGVMIDRVLVDQLGGLSRVQREAPVYRVTELAAGAVFMQATARPMPLTDLELQRVLPEFEAYLEPISAPIGPYFRTRYAK